MINETPRSRNLRALKKNIYISCEGDAEEAYLLGLKRKYQHKVTIRISNSDKTAAIDVVKNLKEKFGSEYSHDDLKFCIFDFDENTFEQLKIAQSKALKIGAEIIFSNPCFEVWLLWHFKNDFSIKTSREKLKNEIENLIRPKYWACKQYPNLYDLVANNYENAKKNHSQRKKELERENCTLYSPVSNPYTNFEELINQLIEM